MYIYVYVCMTLIIDISFNTNFYVQLFFVYHRISLLSYNNNVFPFYS